MPQNSKKTLVKPKSRIRTSCIVGAMNVVVIAGVGWYVYSSSQSSPRQAHLTESTPVFGKVISSMDEVFLIGDVPVVDAQSGQPVNPVLATRITILGSP